MACSPDDAISAELANDVAAGSFDAPPRRWFYTQDGEWYGPVTGPELRAAATGRGCEPTVFGDCSAR